MSRLRPLYPRSSDLKASDKEKAAARGAQGNAESGRSWGAAAGGALGAGIGALGFLGDVGTGGVSLGSIGATTTGLGATAGAALGSALGGQIGSGIDDSNATIADQAGDARGKRISEFELRKAALDAFLRRSK